jgi:hypothetical protein
MKRIATIIASTILIAAAPNYAQAAPVSASVTVSSVVANLTASFRCGCSKREEKKEEAKK